MRKHKKRFGPYGDDLTKRHSGDQKFVNPREPWERRRAEKLVGQARGKKVTLVKVNPFKRNRKKVKGYIRFHPKHTR